MAATFVVEDGSGKADANSYVDVDYADQYFANGEDPVEWSGASTADKQKFLRLATKYLVLAYSDRLYNRRVYQAQALDWPRYNMIDLSGFAIGANVVPNDLKDATCEAALRVAKGDDLMPDVDPDTNGGLIKFEKTQVGPISESIQYEGGKSQLKRYVKIERIMSLYSGDFGQGILERG